MSLKEIARNQVTEDATEISGIVRCALRDIRMGAELRERLAAVLERSDRIARNSEDAPPLDATMPGPFCACGHRLSQCDGSRLACGQAQS